MFIGEFSMPINDGYSILYPTLKSRDFHVDLLALEAQLVATENLMV